jgi:phosphoenolpyruvate carboxylase
MAGSRAQRRAPAGSPELRRDVRRLTTMLGDAIAESDGPELFAEVEALRTATIALRRRPTRARRAHAEAIVDALSRDRVEGVIRAFTCYFQLVNLAEERERVRRLRTRGGSGTPLRDSIDALALEPEVLHDLRITPVLTAHPTETRRRAVVEHLWRIGDLLGALEGTAPGGGEEAELLRRLREEIAGLWRTDPIRRQRPQPLDEVRATLALFDQTIFVTVPALYRAVDRRIDPATCGTRAPGFPTFLTWDTWVGGDRDGNPGVTAEVTRAAVAIQSDHVLRGLETAARRIARSLSVSDRDVRPTARLRRILARDGAMLPAVAGELERKLPDAPHRRMLALMAHRLAATRTGSAGRYPGAERLLADLDTLQRSLADGGAERLAWGELQHLRWQVETFGFHLAAMEVRQHADVHAEALQELRRGTRPRPSTREVVATFRAIADLQRRFGVTACERVVVSFTRSAEDLANVLELARLAVPEGAPAVVPVPLLESRRELEGAVGILSDWVHRPDGRRLLRRREGELEVMVGYSDSAKESGMLAANLGLYEAQRAMAAWSRTQGIRLTIFHGRGGALGRGGGPAGRAIAAEPPGSVGGRFKVTEQGEVAFARYGTTTLARRHLEQITSAVVRATQAEEGPDPADAFTEEIARMASASRAAYESLVRTPGFVAFFRRVTPIAQIGTLPIASRPVARGLDAAAELDDLRAIPWVFAWSQSRINLTAWYGLGAGLAALATRPGGGARLREMVTAWPFFATLLENAELSLAKADTAIADRYLARGERPDLTRAIRGELRRTTDLVLETTGHHRLLDGRPELQRAIELRNPYVDALSLMQVRLLDAPPSARTERLIQATINGVAAGLQNTG